MLHRPSVRLRNFGVLLPEHTRINGVEFALRTFDDEVLRLCPHYTRGSDNMNRQFITTTRRTTQERGTSAFFQDPRDDLVSRNMASIPLASFDLDGVTAVDRHQTPSSILFRRNASMVVFITRKMSLTVQSDHATTIRSENMLYPDQVVHLSHTQAISKSQANRTRRREYPIPDNSPLRSQKQDAHSLLRSSPLPPLHPQSSSSRAFLG